MRMCFNRKVLIGLGAVALGVLAFAPQALGAALPALVLLACPLSMVAMMWGMNRPGHSKEDSSSAPTPSTAADTDLELARLRAELDQLKAETATSQSSHQPS